jgi:hypothetical protein
MNWLEGWKQVAAEIDGWWKTAEVFTAPGVDAHLGGNRADQVAQLLCKQAREIVDRILALPLPSSTQNEVARLADTPVLQFLKGMKSGSTGVVAHMIMLGAMRVPLLHAAAGDEEPRRQHVERAFLHLNRLLTVDGDLRGKWIAAFNDREEECERLGALHLLWHGVYAFKADGGTGITDLVLQEPVVLNEDVLASSALVLTEWKLVKVGEWQRGAPESMKRWKRDTVTKAMADQARDGRRQASRYGRNELGGAHLKHTRYVVLVSPRHLAVPATETENEISYRYVNIALDPEGPSKEASRR